MLTEIGLFSVHVDYFELVDAEGALLSFPLVVDFYDLELFILARLYLVQGSIVFANLQLKLIFAIQSALLRLAAALLLRLSLFNGLVRVHFHLCLEWVVRIMSHSGQQPHTLTEVRGGDEERERESENQSRIPL